MTTKDVTATVSTWQVTHHSQVEWDNVAGAESFQDRYGVNWELADTVCGDYIGLFVNCHPLALFSNQIIDPTEDYARQLAMLVDTIVPYDN